MPLTLVIETVRHLVKLKMNILPKFSALQEQLPDKA